MATSASARDRFFRKVESVLGAEDAEYLMEHLPPIGGDALATKDDLRVLGVELRSEMAAVRADLRGEMAGLRGEMAEMRAELRGEMAELRGEMAEMRGEMAEMRSELRGEMAELRGDMRTGFADLRTEMHTLMRSWTFAVMGLQGVTIAGVIAAVRL